MEMLIPSLDPTTGDSGDGVLESGRGSTCYGFKVRIPYSTVGYGNLISQAMSPFVLRISRLAVGYGNRYSEPPSA